jgi:hypothetical protein
MKNFNKITQYLNNKFGHNVNLISFRCDNKYWPEIYILNCSKCNYNIKLCLSNDSNAMVDLLGQIFGQINIIQLDKIKFIMREIDDINDRPIISSYHKEEDTLNCKELTIKKLLE